MYIYIRLEADLVVFEGARTVRVRTVPLLLDVVQKLQSTAFVSQHLPGVPRA